MITFVLVHSPLVGPVTWEPLAAELERRGSVVRTPDLGHLQAAPEPFWSRHARPAATALREAPPDHAIVLAGHSAAGALLPAIRDLADRPVAAYLLVDAHPPRDGRPRAEGEWLASLRELYGTGGAFPNWSDGQLRDLVPDADLRRRLLSDLRPPPWRYWEEPMPTFADWPDAPCGFLRFTPNPAYDDAAEEARRRSWPSRELPGGHFHMLADPHAVADTLLLLTADLGWV